MTAWARSNKDKFYTNIYARLLPKDVTVEPGQGLEELLTAMSERPRDHVVDGDYTEVGEAETIQ